MPPCQPSADMRALRFARVWRGIGMVLAALVLVASLVPMPGDSAMPSDKVMHLIAYLGLALWFGAVYRMERFAGVGLGLVAFGLLIECLQYGTGYRSFEWADLAADAVGTVVGLVLAATPLGGMLILVEKYLPARG